MDLALISGGPWASSRLTQAGIRPLARQALEGKFYDARRIHTAAQLPRQHLLLLVRLQIRFITCADSAPAGVLDEASSIRRFMSMSWLQAGQRGNSFVGMHRFLCLATMRRTTVSLSYIFLWQGMEHCQRSYALGVKVLLFVIIGGLKAVVDIRGQHEIVSALQQLEQMLVCWPWRQLVAVDEDVAAPVSPVGSGFSDG